MLLYIWVLVLSQNLVSNSASHDKWEDSGIYPKSIPHYPVRIDKYTNKEVARGRFEIMKRDPLGLMGDKGQKVNLTEFKRILQCSPGEPSINGDRGIIDILTMLPPTRAIIESVAVFADVGCGEWRECIDKISIYKQNGHPTGKCKESRKEKNMVRVINGTLHSDWPWCISNPSDSEPYPSMTILLFHVLDLISDMRDSVFLVGAEQSEMPWNVPFPILTNSPDFHNSDIPLPWLEDLRSEYKLYSAARTANDFSENFYSKPVMPHKLEWHKKIEKAAYFGEMISIRQIFFAQALLRPDLIEARWKCDYCNVNTWNPSSNETFNELFQINGDTKEKVVYNAEHEPLKPIGRSEVGKLSPLKSIRITEPANVMIGQYKYLVVLTGVNARAASGRLASFLAYSGAVILLQHSEFEYHFSGRLKPWVHYVPLTYSAADIVDKIEWLKAHDKEAQQIATNARNFGLSYLRLEDQYCYVATLLDTLADIVKDTDANTPFNPIKLKFSNRRLSFDVKHNVNGSLWVD